MRGVSPLIGLTFQLIYRRRRQHTCFRSKGLTLYIMYLPEYSLKSVLDLTNLLQPIDRELRIHIHAKPPLRHPRWSRRHRRLFV
jgi:hypothetical protein